VVLLAGVGSAIAVSAKAPGQQPMTAPAAVTSPSTLTAEKPEVETQGASPESSTEPAQETKNEPAGGGHTDEAPGATTESNVDHQFEGQE
jgi:hypothetical protein